MTQNNQQPAPSEAPIGVSAQYIKDFSFENPNTPQIFAGLSPQSQPQMNMMVNVQTRGLAERTFEVVLFLKLETSLDGKTAFIAELSYAGIFPLCAMSEEHFKMLLLIECPRILFPFARQILMDMIREGGFPSVMISPIDFA